MNNNESFKDQLKQALLSETPSLGITSLMEKGLIQKYIPELVASQEIKGKKSHCYSTYEHTLKVIDFLEPRLELRLAGLFHDLGKIKTEKDIGIDIIYPEHEKVSAEIAKQRLEEIGFDQPIVDYVTNLVAHHTFSYNPLNEPSKAQIENFINEVGEGAFFDLLKLKMADKLSSGKSNYDIKGLHLLKQQFEIKDLQEALPHILQTMGTIPNGTEDTGRISPELTQALVNNEVKYKEGDVVITPHGKGVIKKILQKGLTGEEVLYIIKIGDKEMEVKQSELSETTTTAGVGSLPEKPLFTIRRKKKKKTEGVTTYYHSLQHYPYPNPSKYYLPFELLKFVDIPFGKMEKGTIVYDTKSELLGEITSVNNAKVMVEWDSGLTSTYNPEDIPTKFDIAVFSTEPDKNTLTKGGIPLNLKQEAQVIPDPITDTKPDTFNAGTSGEKDYGMTHRTGWHRYISEPIDIEKDIPAVKPTFFVASEPRPGLSRRNLTSKEILDTIIIIYGYPKQEAQHILTWATNNPGKIVVVPGGGGLPDYYFVYDFKEDSWKDSHLTPQVPKGIDNLWLFRENLTRSEEKVLEYIKKQGRIKETELDKVASALGIEVEDLTDIINKLVKEKHLGIDGENTIYYKGEQQVMGSEKIPIRKTGMGWGNNIQPYKIDINGLPNVLFKQTIPLLKPEPIKGSIGVHYFSGGA